MAYDEFLADRIRSSLANREVDFTEKKMMGGLAFMVDQKMCVGIVKDRLMARIGPDRYEEALEMNYVEPMNFTGRPLSGYVFIDQDGLESENDFEDWIQQCLDFNPLAKASKKKKKN